MFYFIYYALFNTWQFLDGVDWFIHEVGHIIFIPFGQFIYMTGGSLFQVLVPLFFVIYFLRNKKIFSGFFVMFWLGQSLINLSIYIKDAITMNLPLVGGTIHDWNFILTQLNLLSKTQLLGSLVYFLGFTIIVLAGSLGSYFLIKTYKS
jgi:hypothetical protein